MSDVSQPEKIHPSYKIAKPIRYLGSIIDIEERVSTQRENLNRAATLPSNYNVNLSNPSEQDLLINTLARNTVATQLRLERAKHLLEKAEEASYKDPLTGLHNRRWGIENLQRRIQYARRTGNRIFLILWDGDRFKDINTQYGHHYGGDQAIKLNADLPAREEEPIARLGGDEFFQTINENASEEAVKAVMKRYDEFIKEESMRLFETLQPRVEFMDDPRVVKVLPLTFSALEWTEDILTASFLSEYKKDLESKGMKNFDAELLLQAASVTMLRAKESGRNRGFLGSIKQNDLEIEEIYNPSKEMNND